MGWKTVSDDLESGAIRFKDEQNIPTDDHGFNQLVRQLRVHKSIKTVKKVIQAPRGICREG